MIRKNIKINNQLISYLEFEPQNKNFRGLFLILHGWGSKSEKWIEIGNLLNKQGFKIIIPDLPGFGESDEPIISWSLDNYVNLIEDFTKQLNLEKFYLLGHSFGGSLSIKSSLKFPHKIKKLFLVASSGIRRETTKKKILIFISKIFKVFSFIPFYESFRKLFYRIIVGKTDYIYTKQGFSKETFLKVIKEDISHLLAEIKTPTIVIWGDKDTFTPIADAYLMNKKIRGSRLIVIKGSDHYFYRKSPENLVKNIMESL